MTSIFRRSGRKGWTLKYRTLDGEWRYEQKPTRQACEDRAIELRQVPESSRLVLFRDYAQTWLARTKQHVRPGTHSIYASQVKAHLGPAFGHLPLRDLKRGLVKDFIAGKLASGLARKYVANMRATLRTCLEEAREDGLLSVNPADRLRRDVGPRVLAPPKALDAEQVKAFLSACRRESPRWWILFRLMSLTGLRLGEALALRWEDIDSAQRMLHVRRGYTRGKVQPTKSGRERWVDLAGVLVEELQRYDVERKAEALKAGEERAPWLFPSIRRNGRPADHFTVRRVFDGAIKAAGLPVHFTPHSLRHSFACLMLARNRSIKYVQAMLGHATITMTVDTYGSSLPIRDPGAVDDLAEVTSDRPAKRRKA